MIIHGSLPDGVEIRTLDRHQDSRGSFMEVFRRSWGTGIDPEQFSVVQSRPGTLRGMHIHRRHDEYFCVLSGSAHVGLRDIRPGSPTEGQSLLIHLQGSAPAVLVFPTGIVHGWLFGEETVHLQGVSEDYGSYGGDDNRGCHWSDPGLDLPWPFQPTLIADRAAGFGLLQDLVDWMRET
jgi:dTDP-4-dehydrorhamnose 3,5-epimerase